MIRVRLRQIIEEHFGRSEKTMYHAVPVKVRGALKAGDAIMFASKSGKLLQWVYKNGSGDALLSVKIRVDRGTWNPEMLQNYANQVGLEIEGIKTFEQYHAARMRV